MKLIYSEQAAKQLGYIEGKMRDGSIVKYTELQHDVDDHPEIRRFFSSFQYKDHQVVFSGKDSDLLSASFEHRRGVRGIKTKNIVYHSEESVNIVDTSTKSQVVSIQLPSIFDKKHITNIREQYRNIDNDDFAPVFGLRKMKA